MLNKVRKFLKNKSPDWLNTEVNKDLLQNLSASLCKGDGENLEEFDQVISSHIKSKPREVKRSQTKFDTNTNFPLMTDDCSLMTVKGTPHWRRIRQVFQALDNAPLDASYNQLIEYVRETTGVGCSRKLISKWKKQKNSHQSSDISHQLGSIQDEIGSSELEKTTNDNLATSKAVHKAIAPTQISKSSVANDSPSTVNNLHLAQKSNKPTRKKSLMTDDWSLMTVLTAGIMVSLVGCEIIPFNSRPSENIAIASVTAPITPLTPIPERRKNRLEPRNIKIELTLSNPQDLKVKPGDKISAGQVLSGYVRKRDRLILVLRLFCLLVLL